MKADHPHIIFRDLGLIGYKEAWETQESMFNQLVKSKMSPESDLPPQYLLFCEHPHVYTLGKSGDEGNLLIHRDFLKKINATYYRTNRGGDITYHGPGQVVGYPILDLESLSIGLKRYVQLLEEAIIQLLADYGLETTRMKGATGVWMDATHPVRARKICAIGVRSSRHVTMHGFALNVNTNLEYFTYINPCGLDTRGVTSMEKELGKSPEMPSLKDKLRGILMSLLLSPGKRAA